jgi:hypothetical protein
MTMKNKVLVYAVLAISLGFLLVSEVPNQLAPPMFGEPAGDSEMVRAPGQENAEAPAEGESAPVTELDETFSSDAATAQGDASDASAARSTSDEALAAGGGSGNLVISVFGTWSVNLIVALGVYFIARRRFS